MLVSESGRDREGTRKLSMDLGAVQGWSLTRVRPRTALQAPAQPHDVPKTQLGGDTHITGSTAHKRDSHYREWGPGDSPKAWGT